MLADEESGLDRGRHRKCVGVPSWWWDVAARKPKEGLFELPEQPVSVAQKRVEHKKEGVFNAANGYLSNKQFMKTISKKMKKPFFLPTVPRPILSLVLGEMSTMLTESLKVSNDKIKKTGFTFTHEDFDAAMAEVVKKDL